MLPSVSVPTPIAREAGGDRRRRCRSSIRRGCDRARTDSSSGRRASSSRTTIASSGNWPIRSDWSCRGSRRRHRASARRRTHPRFGRLSASASEPAEFTMPATSMLSLMRTGMPCSGPRTLPDCALGVERLGILERPTDSDSITALSLGPASSIGRDAIEIRLRQRVRRQRARRHPRERIGRAQLDDINSGRAGGFTVAEGDGVDAAGCMPRARRAASRAAPQERGARPETIQHPSMVPSPASSANFELVTWNL